MGGPAGPRLTPVFDVRPAVVYDGAMATTTKQDEKRVIDAAPHQMFIGGQWRDGSTQQTLGIEDPATGETLCEIADGTPDDAKAALDAACAVQDDWAATPPRDRGEILRRAFELMTERADDLGLLMTLEMGKPIAESAGEITYAAEFLRWFSEEAVRIDGRYAINPAGAGRLLTMKQAIGPCLLITPWNFPTAMGTRKIGPAIAAGCTMVVKPAQQTPLSMLALAALLREAGLAGRRPQRRHHQQGLRRHRPAVRRQPAAQDVVHRLDPRRQDPDEAGLEASS